MVIASAAALVVASGSPATAQSLLQSIFGFFQAPQPQKEISPRRPEPPKAIPWVGSNEDRAEIQSARPGSGGGSAKGPWRTMCVRLCDGYYFPVSSGVSRTRFADDAKTCESRCGVPARLFYIDKESDDIAAMVDLKGRAYGDLATAFRYRKRLTDGCTCRPMPWSAAERARHKRYEVFDAYMKLQAERDAEAERRAEARILELAEQQRDGERPEAASPGVGTEAGDELAADALPAGTEVSAHAPAGLTGDHAEETPAYAATEGSPAQPARALVMPRTERRTRRQSWSGGGSQRRQKPRPAAAPAPAYGLGGLFAPAPTQHRWPGDR